MSRIIAIDFGLKRTGIAVTDPMQIIATALDTVETSKLLPYLQNYAKSESIDSFVIGMPKNLDNSPSEIAHEVTAFIVKLKSAFPGKSVHEADERFTSKMAADSMIMSGMKKKDRKNKKNLDSISATLILQNFLSSKPL